MVELNPDSIATVLVESRHNWDTINTIGTQLGHNQYNWDTIGTFEKIVTIFLPYASNLVILLIGSNKEHHMQAVKTFTFTETDPKYIAEFKEHFAAQMEIVDDRHFKSATLNPSQIHGFEESTEDESTAQVETFLSQYRGTNDFVRSVAGQYSSGRRLSVKQIEAIKRFLDAATSKPAQNNVIQMVVAPKPVEAPVFTLKTGEYVLVNKFMAKVIGLQCGLNRPHHGLQIIAVKRETEKAWLIDASLMAQKSSHCSICGLTLKDPQSIAIGIGPICADNNGIPHGDASIEMLNQQLSAYRVNNIWIAKRSVKERQCHE
jgi:ribulose bisphosphate carboxylase small subunit